MSWKPWKNDAAQARAGAATAADVSDGLGAVDRPEPSFGSSRSCDQLVVVRGDPGQHFSGMRHFQHQMPIGPSSMTRMRERPVKAARAEGLTIKQSYRHVGRRLRMHSSRMPLPAR